MNKRRVIVAAIVLISMSSMKAQRISTETVMAKDGKPVEFYFIKHASVYFTYDGIVFYIDPVSYPDIDYGQLPKADYILITHDHYDHFDTNAIELVAKTTTVIVGNQVVKDKLSRKCMALENYAVSMLQGIEIKAFPAYNTTQGRDIYHPKGRDNGYLIHLGGFCVYFAGDCEDMPEMENIGLVDAAFLPVNQPYTMTVKQAIHAAEMIKPKILFPYHYSDTDLKGLDILNEKGIKVIINH